MSISTTPSTMLNQASYGFNPNINQAQYMQSYSQAPSMMTTQAINNSAMVTNIPIQQQLQQPQFNSPQNQILTGQQLNPNNFIKSEIKQPSNQMPINYQNFQK